MSARPDPRWARMTAGVRRYDEDPPGTRRLTVEVADATGRYRVGRSCVISDQARHQSYVDPLLMVLDDIVREIDAALHD